MVLSGFNLIKLPKVVVSHLFISSEGQIPYLTLHPVVKTDLALAFYGCTS